MTGGVLRARWGVIWARLSSWWPDFFGGILIAFGYALLMLLGGSDVGSVSISRAIGTGGTYVWCFALMLCGIGMAVGMAASRFTLAATASTIAALLFGLNATAAILFRGPGILSSIVVYSLAAVYMAERAKQLDAKVPKMPESFR